MRFNLGRFGVQIYRRGFVLWNGELKLIDIYVNLFAKHPAGLGVKLD